MYYAMEKDLKCVHVILHLGALVAQELIKGDLGTNLQLLTQPLKAAC